MNVELGVGLTFRAGSTAVLDFAAANGDLVQVLEVDPEAATLAGPESGGAGRVDEEALERLNQVPCAKVVRAAGLSAGASRLPDRSSIALVREIASELDAGWVSEPLAFHRARGADGDFDSLLPLPPRQTIGGARLAAHSVRTTAKELRRPFALEPHVSYLKPRRDEISDGEFLSEVAEDADCGILLDLGRAWINERNGRQPLEAFLARIPCERVLALRLSSGIVRGGYWVEASSGIVSSELFEIALALVPRLSRLSAILLDVEPASLQRLGTGGLRDQLSVLQTLWAERRAGHQGSVVRASAVSSSRWKRDRSFPPRDWEDALGCLVVGRKASGEVAEELARDPGVVVFQELLAERRAAMVAAGLMLTSRLITASHGPAFLRSLLESYWKKETPRRSTPLEALGFAEYLSGLSLEIPYLAEVLDYEKALVRSTLDGEHRVVSFQHDPRVVLRALAKGRLPGSTEAGRFQVEVA